ncbi:MAG: hypothetical protein ABH846_02825, partial [Patescibacteria group bacterium]
ACAFIFSLVFLALGALEPWLISYFGEVDVSAKAYFFDNAVIIFGGQFLALSILSLLTTMYAMRKYLRV